MQNTILAERPCVRDLRESRLNTYREMPNDISSHYNDEGENEENYYGRFAYELIQNADDAVGKTDDPENPCVTRFELETGSDPHLIVANSGSPVDDEDARALTTIGDTTKRDADRKATIGHKGRGFSAVLEITEHPYVFSTDVSFMFDRARSRKRIEEAIAELDEWEMDDIAGIPLMRLPFAPDRCPSRVESLLQAEHETAFYFPLREEAVADVRNALAELDEQTVLFLNNLNRLEVAIDGETTTWEIGRHDSTIGAVSSDVDSVKIRRRGATPTEVGYLRFTRDEVEIGAHTAGISNNTWGDVAHTQVSVAVRADRRDDGTHLLPVRNDPQAHVFLPTEERSPIPLLVNGAFDSNLSRKSIDITEHNLDYNRFLIREAANIISSDIATVARRTATTASEFLACLNFTTWADPDSRDDNTFRDELIRAIQDEMADVDCVPVGDTTDTGTTHVMPMQTLIPSILDESREAIVDFVDHWDGRHVELDDDTTSIAGFFPRAQLLDAEHDHVPDVLRTLGASAFPIEYLPKLLPELPDDWFAIDSYPPGPQRTATDPVIELVAAMWEPLDDDAKETFAAAARAQPLVPVGTPFDDGSVTRVRADDTELYLPREDGELDVDIPGVRFVTEYVYRPRSRLGSQALPPTVESRQSVIRQVWRPDSFQFEELVRTTVAPRLSGGQQSERGDGTIDIGMLALLRELGEETADPDAPLPLRDRYDAQPLYRLCQLPVPIQNQGWCPAHRVYFGTDWLSDDVRSVERLLEKAEIDAPMLVSPETIAERLRDQGFDLEDGIDVSAWFEFLRWIGVSPHLRLRPFFAPDEQRQFSATVAEGVVDRPSNGTSVLGDLDEDTWEAYRDHLKAALDGMSAGRQKYDSIHEVNSFEFWETIHRKARSDTDVGQALMDHLIAWWEPVFSDHRVATLATHSVGGFSGRNSSSQSSSELREVGTNLWLWQLQTDAWCPSSRGAVEPSTIWDPPQRQSIPFTIGEQSLLPILERGLDPAEYEAQPLLEDLGIRRHLSSETFTPVDARTVCEGLADVCRTGDITIAESLRDIQPIYRQVQDLAPPVDEPLPEDSAWQDATAELANCPVLCRVSGTFEFCDAREAYFARSPSVRADYPFDDLPFFVLEEQRSARFGQYFGLHDFTAAVMEDGEPITAREDRTRAVTDHLKSCASHILCRLEAERPSQRLIDRDRDRMRSFLNSLTVVEEIQVTYTLDPIGDETERKKTTTTEFYIETRPDGAVEERFPYAVHREHEREQWQLLARALCAYLDVTQFEGIDALLSASTDQERRQYLQYANAPSSPDAIRQKRLRLDESEKRSPRGEFGEPEPVGGQGEDGDSSEREEEADSEISQTEPSEQSVASDVRSPPAELYDASELRVGGEPIPVTPSSTSAIDSASDADLESVEEVGIDSEESALRETSPSDRRRDQSQYDVEDLGAALVEAWEATRLRREHPDCDDPSEFVFRTDERHLVDAAREHPNAARAFEVLETEAGIPEHFPGFDLLTVNPETKEPDRLIELKAATCRRRKPSVSWNEWTTARNDWIQAREMPLYYLYVVGHLSKRTSPDPYIRTIPNPFRLLNAQVEREVTVTQSVQVDVNAFTDEEPVLEVPVATQSKE
ncbi:sacsin N-terminal ATP-binding-like domain-containing protein [Halosolutus halophilus]|uniref:sacsin N-terminal ATP-binding-like domain-containing protein n=1 Tax=Halosolutus halophilus TaxID=1552990 RepID=UPI0022351776|nr:hypothetical protein [Halosolutus halophilus]